MQLVCLAVVHIPVRRGRGRRRVIHVLAVHSTQYTVHSTQHTAHSTHSVLFFSSLFNVPFEEYYYYIYIWNTIYYILYLNVPFVSIAIVAIALRAGVEGLVFMPRVRLGTLLIGCLEVSKGC